MLPVIVAASFGAYLIKVGQPAGERWRWFLRDMFRLRDINPNSVVLAETALAAVTQLAALATMLWVLFGRRASRFLLPAPLVLFVLLRSTENGVRGDPYILPLLTRHSSVERAPRLSARVPGGSRTWFRSQSMCISVRR